MAAAPNAMPRRDRLRVLLRPFLLPVLCGMMVGCRSTSPTLSRASTSQPTTGPFAWFDASVTQRILSGLDVSAWGDASHAGDAVLLGLRAENGRRVITRYLLVTMTDGVNRKVHGSMTLTIADGASYSVLVAPPSRVTTMQVFDETGRSIRTSSGMIAERTLNHGLFFLKVAESAEKSKAQTAMPSTSLPSTVPVPGSVPDAKTLAQAQAMALAMAAVFTFTQSTGKNSVLGELALTVADRPSLLDLLRGIRLDLNIASIEGCQAQLDGAAWPAAKIVFDVALNDRPTLRATVTAVPPVPPLGLVSGVVAIDGDHPSDPWRHLHVRVLAARRGNGAEIQAYRIPGLSVPATPTR